jgi:hypothetical protein
LHFSQVLLQNGCFFAIVPAGSAPGLPVKKRRKPWLPCYLPLLYRYSPVKIQVAWLKPLPALAFSLSPQGEGVGWGEKAMQRVCALLPGNSVSVHLKPITAAKLCRCRKGFCPPDTH